MTARHVVQGSSYATLPFLYVFLAYTALVAEVLISDLTSTPTSPLSRPEG